MPEEDKHHEHSEHAANSHKSLWTRIKGLRLRWKILGSIILAPFLLFILLGVAGIIIERTERTQNVSYLKEGNKPLVQGVILNENDKPIDGARIATKTRITTTGPKGDFIIAANPSDVLSISAFGYQNTTTSASNPNAKLIALPGGTVRISVLDVNRKPLENSLVMRLDPNTSAPISQAVTDKYGSAYFADIPSGQAAFVVLHPNYGAGWVELPLAPGGQSQQVIVLQEITPAKKVSKTSGNWFAKSAYAQNANDTLTPAAQNGNKLKWQISQLDQGKNTSSIDSSAFVVVDLNDQRLKQLIDALNQVASSASKGLPINPVYVQNLLQNGYSPVSTYRVHPENSENTSYITYPVGGQPQIRPMGNLTTQRAKTLTIQLPDQNTTDAMALLQLQYQQNLADAKSDPNTVVATTWSEASKAEAEGHTVIFNNPLVTVCCNRPLVEGGASGSVENLPSSVSSNTLRPSGINVQSINGNTTVYTPSYDANTAGGSMVTAGQDARKHGNPNSSLLSIPAPNPAVAPADFLHDFFGPGENPSLMYNQDPSTYQYMWENYNFYQTQQAEDHGVPLASVKNFIQQTIANQQIQFTAANAAAAAAGIGGGLPGAAGAGAASNVGNQSSNGTNGNGSNSTNGSGESVPNDNSGSNYDQTNNSGESLTPGENSPQDSEQSAPSSGNGSGGSQQYYHPGSNGWAAGAQSR